MPKIILTVDDEPSILKVVSFRLKKAGYETATADDGAQALEWLAKNRADLVILDLCLPVVDGYEVCRRMKADERLRSVPILLFTASSGGRNVEKITKELQAQDYLVKPFEPEALLEKVKQLAG